MAVSLHDVPSRALFSSFRFRVLSVWASFWCHVSLGKVVAPMASLYRTRVRLRRLCRHFVHVLVAAEVYLPITAGVVPPPLLCPSLVRAERARFCEVLWRFFRTPFGFFILPLSFAGASKAFSIRVRAVLSEALLRGPYM